MFPENPQDPLANVDPETVHAFLDEVAKRMDTCGLTMLDPVLTTVDDPHGQQHVVFAAHFDISRYALTTEVLDAEQAQFDQQFREFSVEDDKLRIEELRKRYQKDDE